VISVMQLYISNSCTPANFLVASCTIMMVLAFQRDV